MTKEQLKEIKNRKADERYTISKAPYHAALDPAFILHEEVDRNYVADWLRGRREWVALYDDRSFTFCGNLWTFEQIDESNPLLDCILYIQKIVEPAYVFGEDYAADIDDDDCDFAEVASAVMHEEMLNDK